MTATEATKPEPCNDAERRIDAIGQEALLRRLRAGEGDAFELLVRAYGGRLLAVAQRMLGSADEAADAVQEAFVSAFKSIERFEGTARLATWLHRIVVNAALMRLRTRRRRPEVSIETLLPSFLPDGHRREPRPGWTAGSDELLSNHETRRTVREAIDRLPDEYRTVLLLRDIEEMDSVETAEALGISVGAVKTRLHRARMALRTLLEGELA